MRDPVSLLFYRVLAVIYDIWTRKIFGPFPPYILKYNALRFGAESFSFFRLIPEHVVTAFWKKVGLKAGDLCCPRNVVCCISTHKWEKVKIFCDFKFLWLQISVSSCHFLTPQYRSPQQPILIYHQSMIRLQACDDDVLLCGTSMLHYAHVVRIKPRRWKREINTSHAHSIFTSC